MHGVSRPQGNYCVFYCRFKIESIVSLLKIPFWFSEIFIAFFRLKFLNKKDLNIIDLFALIMFRFEPQKRFNN